MKKNYNYGRRKLFLPEYGRHIHEMIDSLLTIEDRRERNRQARAVIAVMGNLNPLLRDTADFTHKLWDHLFIMSDFQLDVDSPYPRPSREELTVTPKRMTYSQGRIAYKHYGRYVERMLGAGRRARPRGGGVHGRQPGPLHACQELRIQPGASEQRGDRKGHEANVRRCGGNRRICLE